jgi:hypothetical protein
MHTILINFDKNQKQLMTATKTSKLIWKSPTSSLFGFYRYKRRVGIIDLYC